MDNALLILAKEYGVIASLFVLLVLIIVALVNKELKRSSKETDELKKDQVKFKDAHIRELQTFKNECIEHRDDHSKNLHQLKEDLIKYNSKHNEIKIISKRIESLMNNMSTDLRSHEKSIIKLEIQIKGIFRISSQLLDRALGDSDV